MHKVTKLCLCLRENLQNIKWHFLFLKRQLRRDSSDKFHPVKRLVVCANKRIHVRRFVRNRKKPESGGAANSTSAFSIEQKPLLDVVIFLSLYLLSLSLSHILLAVWVVHSGDDYAYKNVISHREPTIRDACGLGWRACGQTEIYD